MKELNNPFLKQASSSELAHWLKAYREETGGVLYFLPLQISNAEGPPRLKKEEHFEIAKATILGLPNYLSVDDDSEQSKTDIAELKKSGVRIEVQKFLGWAYDFEVHKPIMRGRLDNETLNSYFYYDEQEKPENAIDKRQSSLPQNRYRKDLGAGFVYAFMEPPYGFGFSKVIRERGEFLLQFMDTVFGNLEKLEVYAWSTDCDPFFDAGKEWWGTFFWTVYSPENDWYVGILGSATD